MSTFWGARSCAHSTSAKLRTFAAGPAEWSDFAADQDYLDAHVEFIEGSMPGSPASLAGLSMVHRGPVVTVLPVLVVCSDVTNRRDHSTRLAKIARNSEDGTRGKPAIFAVRAIFVHGRHSSRPP